MKIDRFTKVILTVIALNLTLLTLSSVDIFPTANANGSAKGISPQINYGLIPLNDDGSITVKFERGSELDINITGIETTDELDINIDEIGGGYVSSGGPIEVEIKE